MAPDVRWKQRRENLARAFALLTEAAQAVGLNRLEQEGSIHRFEYTFELAWKSLKDLLLERGVDASFPRDVIKAAFSAELIEDGDIWIDMLERRNQLSHTYNETVFTEAVDRVRTRFFPAVAQLVARLESLA